MEKNRKYLQNRINVMLVSLICLCVVCAGLLIWRHNRQDNNGQPWTDPNTVQTTSNDTEPTQPASGSAVKEYRCQAQYVRTDAVSDSVFYPKITVIESCDDLQTYYEKYKYVFQLDRAAGENGGFLGACAKYDDAYFAQHKIVLVAVEENSGSVRHTVTKISGGGQNWEIYIDRSAPQIGTSDMAQWHIFVEVQSDIGIDKDDIIELPGYKTGTKDTLVKK